MFTQSKGLEYKQTISSKDNKGTGITSYIYYILLMLNF